MKKQDLIRKMEEASGTKGFITASQFAQFMGCTNISKCKYKFLSGLDRVEGKYYFIPDVAAVLMDRRDSAV